MATPSQSKILSPGCAVVSKSKGTALSALEIRTRPIRISFSLNNSITSP
jgi:hypothetical protein